MVYYSDIENKALHDLRQIEPAITPDFEGRIDARELFDLLSQRGGAQFFYSSKGGLCMLLDTTPF